TSVNYIGLAANGSGQYPNTTGYYTSKIFNTSFIADWKNISWDEYLPSISYSEIDYMEYSSNASAQTAYVSSDASGYTAITNCVGLQAMQNDLSGNYYLANDINCTYDTQNASGALYNGGAGFDPIGTFTGIFDGNGHTITGLYINRPSTSFGGLFGYINGAEIKNLGLINVDITGNDYVGGLVGYHIKSITTKCYATGAVSGDGYVGGLFGRCDYGVANCYSKCAVSGSSSVGGLVGWLTQYSSRKLEKCYSMGAVSGSSSVGGLVGSKTPGGTITDCFWDTQTSGQGSSAGGTGKTTAQMKQQATFTNWDFDDVWDITESITYPFLQPITGGGDFVSNLQSYSEPTIKQQGSYSLKVIAKQTDSLNDILTKTVSPTINLSGKGSIKLDVRANRTGSNFKISIHDSGGTTTEHTINIATANTWQTERWDISGVSNANKDVIDQIIITITNADANNTFYIDNLIGNDINTNINISLRDCNDPACSGDSWDITCDNSTFCDISSLTGSQYIQYKAKLETDNTSITPQLNTSSVIIGFEEDTAPPTVTLNIPTNSNNSIDINSNVIFNCSATDNTALANITLYNNANGTLTAIETKTLTGTSDSA
ncbi:MAG: hypothetical protein KAU20_06680, partial [Nanoarchaeota archaeon]|nr:hypothetical protein [Nanoarchaeota archaeon]